MVKPIDLERIKRIAETQDFEGASQIIGFDARKAYDKMEDLIRENGFTIPPTDMAKITHMAYGVSKLRKEARPRALDLISTLLKAMTRHFENERN